jgi:hypothetical protein
MLKTQKNRSLILTPLFLLLLLAMGGAKLNAQCNCKYVVGTGSPSGISTLSVAIDSFPGIEAPGDSCVKIIGQFNVDANETWNLGPTSPALSRIIFANSGSSLFVLNGGTLNATPRAVFIPCNPFGTWRGVFIQSGGTINTDSARFINANIAGISISNDAYFDIRGSLFVECTDGLRIIGQQTPANHTVEGNQFYNCTTGIDMLSAINVNILNNWYHFTGLTNTNPSTHTGIHLEGFCRNISITQGDFDSLACGINTVKTKNLDIIGAKFKTCQSGIFSMQGSDRMYINDCTFEKTGKIGIQVNMHEVNAGPTANLLIDHNQFLNHGTSSNIYLEDILTLGQCAVSNNTIDLPAPGPTPWAFAANGIAVDNFDAAGGLSITGNVLTSDNAGMPPPGGIDVQQASKNVVIDNNTVNAVNGGSLATHIRATICTADVTMKGNSTDGGSSISQKGISIENCPGLLTLCCNTLTNSGTGLYFTGPLNGAQIYTTSFGNHPFAALHYNQVSSTGAPQIHHGNDWRMAAGAWDARFDGASGVAAITNYEVDNTLLPNGLSKISAPASIPFWFVVTPATEPDCNTSAGCTGNREGEREAQNNIQSGSGQQAAFSVYPNPADQFLTIRFTENAVETQVILRDVAGRLRNRLQIHAGTNQAQVPVGMLDQGLYILEIKQTGKPDSFSKIFVAH